MAFDVETTGLSPKDGDRIIEIGAVAIEEGKIVNDFQSLINVDRHIPRSVQQIHNITNKMLIGKPKPEEVIPKFQKFIKDSALVAHNAKFDITFLLWEFTLLKIDIRNKYFCTLELSRKLYPRLPNHKLETVFRHLFGERHEKAQRHRALEDARLTAMIWLEMRKRKK